MRGRGRIGCLVRVAVSVMVVLWASGALAAWVVNERGECVRAWTPASLVRGPAAVLNARPLPFGPWGGGALPGGVGRPGYQARTWRPRPLPAGAGARGLVGRG